MSTWWNAIRESIRAIAADTPSRKNQITDRLTQFRISAVQEARASFRNNAIDLPDVETNLAHALDDVCEALGLDQQATRQVIGEAAYTYIYDMPAFEIPASLRQEYRAARQTEHLLAQMKQWPSVRAGHITLRK